MGLSYLFRLGKRTGLSTILFLAIPANIARAQVVPDGTLESAVETIQELMKINGGQRAGNNLFHSFEEFSIPEGMEASFQNAIDIENIFTRVTGNSISNINGILSAQGGANLFLMNPNGIVFGGEASINVGGSFIATTADSINFPDGSKFSATDAAKSDPLNIEFPVGLGFTEKPNGAIVVRGEGSEIRQTSPSEFSIVGAGEGTTGLRVLPGKNLALVGGKVDLEGGTLTASEGQIFIGSVESGLVTLQPNTQGWNFAYEKVSNFQDIELTKKALIDASGKGSGTIKIYGANVKLTDGSLVLIQNQGDTPSGSISVNAEESLLATGVASDGSLIPSSFRTETLGQGKAGDLKFFATNLLLEERGGINTLTYGSGDSGNLDINISEFLQLTGNPAQAFNTGRITSITLGSGKAGNVQISTPKLQATNGSEISTSSLGTGEGGNLKIDANEIELVGVDLGTKLPTAIRAGAFGTGNAGSITVDTSSLKLTDGAAVNTTSRSGGAAGDVTINASSFIEVSGKNAELDLPSSIDSSVTAASQSSRNPFGLSREPTGKSGNVTVNTELLNLNNEGSLGAINEGSGNAGTLSINANEVSLDSNAAIAATSASGTGGNVELNADNLNIDNGGEITTTAGNEGQGGNINIKTTNLTAKKNSLIGADASGGNGGNITIDSETILGLDNSDITANAIQGDGGNITITADAIVGLEKRATETPLSDITASSEFGQSGTITINSPESNTDEEAQIAAREKTQNLATEFVQSCREGRGRFTYIGMGLPESPYNYFDDSGKHSPDSDLVQLPPPNYPPLDQPQNEQHRRELEGKPPFDTPPWSDPILKPTNENPPGDQTQRTPVIQRKDVIGRIAIDPRPTPHTKDGKRFPIIYSQTNEVPPLSLDWQPGMPRLEPNAVQINPNGKKYMVRIEEIVDPKDPVCTREARN